MRKLVCALLVAGLTTGCGYKKEIEALQGSVMQHQAWIADRDATIEAQKTTIAGLQDEIQQASDRIAELEGDVAAKQGELDAEREKSSRILADRGSLREEVRTMKQAIAELEERKRRAEERISSYRDLVERFRSMIDAGTLDVRFQDGRMVVALATDVLFASGSADLSDDGKAALTQVAQVFQGMPDRKLQIEGHTDNVPIKSAQYPSNWYLAAGRAIGVVNHLVASGLNPDSVSGASYGEFRPVADNTTEEGRSLNRRIEIVLVPDLRDLPGNEELEAL